MTVADTIETNITNIIADYGSSVTIQKQTATYNTYDERTPNWTNSTSVSTTAIILPPVPKSYFGEEFSFEEQGALQKADYISYFKATETLEESSTTTAATRYLIVFKSLNYEIIMLKPTEIQDNILVKKCYLKLLTS